MGLIVPGLLRALVGAGWGSIPGASSSAREAEPGLITPEFICFHCQLRYVLQLRAE